MAGGAGKAVFGQQGGLVHLAFGHDPAVGAAAAALHRCHAGPHTHNARQPARQHPPRLGAVRHRIHPQQHRARHDVAAGLAVGLGLPGGHLRQRQIRLHRVFVTLAHDAACPFVELPARLRAAQHRMERAVVAVAHIGGLDDRFAQPGQGLLHGRTLAAPPGGQGRQQQRFAAEMARQRRHETQQRSRFQKARARRIGHQHIAGTDRLQQAGHAQPRIGPQLHRVQERVVEPFQQAVHRLQPAQGFQVHALVAHREVAALHQSQAEVARQVGVLEIGFVVGARGEQRNVGVGPGAALLLHAVDQRAVGAGQALDVQALEGLRKQPRNGQPVLQQVAQARRRLRALRNYPEVTVGPARQVKCRHMQMGAARRRDAAHGAQVTRVALHQRRRQQAFL